MKINLTKKLLIVVSFLLCVSLNQFQVKANQIIEFCMIDSSITKSIDFQFDDLEAEITCFLEDDTPVNVTIEWSLVETTIEKFNNNQGTYNLTGTLTSDSPYSLSNPLEMVIIKEGYSILDGSTLVTGDDLNSLLASATSDIVKVTSVIGELSADMFTGGAKTLDLSELEFTTLGNEWFKGMPNLTKVVLPATVDEFEGTVSLKELEVVVTTTNSIINYNADPTLEKAFFTALSFNTLEQLDELSLTVFMNNELDSSVEVKEAYSSGNIQIAYDYLDGLSLNGLNHNEIKLKQRVLFGGTIASHPKQGIIRYYGVDKETYLDQGISYSANYQEIDEGILASYTFTNHSSDASSEYSFSLEGTIVDSTFTNNNHQVLISNSDKQLVIESNTHVNQLNIRENNIKTINRVQNTGVNGFIMEWQLSSLHPNQTDTIEVLFKVMDINHSSSSNSLPASSTYFGWIIRDKDNKLVEKMKRFEKQYDDNYKVYYSEKDVLSTGWKCIQDEWYFFREDGICIMKGWIKDLEDWYYFDNYSCATNQWIATTNGRWYYQDQQGRMVRDKVIEGYSVNEYGIYWGH